MARTSLGLASDGLLNRGTQSALHIASLGHLRLVTFEPPPPDPDTGGGGGLFGGRSGTGRHRKRRKYPTKEEIRKALFLRLPPRSKQSPEFDEIREDLRREAREIEREKKALRMRLEREMLARERRFTESLDEIDLEALERLVASRQAELTGRQRKVRITIPEIAELEIREISLNQRLRLLLMME